MTVLLRNPTTFSWRNGNVVFGAALIVGASLTWLDRTRLGELPWWLPWQFSWVVFGATIASLYWFLRGLERQPPALRPPWWRRVTFILGVVLIYVMLQTHFDYQAQHMFFLHRLQHLVLHHLGPFLIGLASVGGTIVAGMPAPLRRGVTHPVLKRTMDVIQNPILAPILFFGVVYFWLIPPIHFRAMLDQRVYEIMNWSVAIDGIWFWTMVLDPRRKPPARLSYAGRILVALAVMPPQIAIGSYLAFARTNLFPSYALCGRLWDINPITDQGYGGMILWIPGSMMSAIAVILVLNAMRIADEQQPALS